MVTRLRPQTPLTLLVLEDDVVTRVAVTDELRTNGFKVLEANTADDAIVVLQSVPVHLVFASLDAPGRRSGLDLVRLAQELRPPPRIVLTSGRMPPEDRAGTAAFIPKPYSMPQLIELVRRVLDVPDGSSA